MPLEWSMSLSIKIIEHGKRKLDWWLMISQKCQKNKENEWRDKNDSSLIMIKFKLKNEVVKEERRKADDTQKLIST